MAARGLLESPTCWNNSLTERKAGTCPHWLSVCCLRRPSDWFQKWEDEFNMTSMNLFGCLRRWPSKSLPFLSLWTLNSRVALSELLPISYSAHCRSPQATTKMFLQIYVFEIVRKKNKIQIYIYKLKKASHWTWLEKISKINQPANNFAG